MSRFDKQHEEEWRRQREREASMFVVGATVYRHKYDRIQTGVLCTVGRCNDPDDGECADGTRPYYAASFINAPGCLADWQVQSFSRHFFATEDEARAALMADIERRIEDKRLDIRRLETLLASVRAA